MGTKKKKSDKKVERFVNVGTLTTKSVVGGDIKKNVSSDMGKAVELFHVIGRVNQYGVKQTPVGEVFIFHGLFRAYRKKDSKRFSSTKLIALNPVSDSLVYLVNECDGSRLSFACSVSVVTDESMLGYHYRSDFLVNPFEADPLCEIERRYRGALAGQDVAEAKSGKRSAIRDRRDEAVGSGSHAVN